MHGVDVEPVLTTIHAWENLYSWFVSRFRSRLFGGDIRYTRGVLRFPAAFGRSDVSETNFGQVLLETIGGLGEDRGVVDRRLLESDERFIF